MNTSRENFGFSVDTHLFRELGELLVGRDSTALIELVKNAYDADATHVTVYGRDLLQVDGAILVNDDGIGMTPHVFDSAFLRIAGRHKEEGLRLSPLFRRRYTGAKGVGRLSAHKLARRLVVWSRPRIPADGRGIDATIEWERMEEDYATLEEARGGLKVLSFTPTADMPYGTELRLEELRRKWTLRNLPDFVAAISSCRAPAEMIDPPPKQVFARTALPVQLRVATHDKKDPGFTINFEGDLNVGESLWPQFLARTDWLVEIDANADGVQFSIQPSVDLAEMTSDHHEYRLRREHPDSENGPFFKARIYARQGSIGARASSLAKFSQRYGGIRVYVEGFRVLPYGDSGDDWLNLDRDYARRPREFEIDLDAKSSWLLEPIEKEGFLSQGNDQYVGAVFMTADGAATLRPVVNREGFIQDPAFEALRDLVRNGVDLLTRVRASSKRKSDNQKQRSAEEALRENVSRAGEQPSAQNTRQSENVSEEERSTAPSDRLSLPISISRLELQELKAEFESSAAVSQRLDRIQKSIDYIEEAAQESDEGATLRILAGVGLQLAAFVHEINGILGLAQSIRAIADAIRREPVESSRRPLFRQLESAADQMVQSLARQSSYLVEVVGPDARRRRRRMPYAQAIEPSLSLLSSVITDNHIEVETSLDPNSRTPPMFAAEVAIISTNLLTNAAKAAGDNGKILIRARPTPDGGLRLTIENTGEAVDLTHGERWFRPFESTTTNVDVILGQGMGMGLPIVRRLVSEYNGTVHFVAPSAGFATAIEVVIPGRRTGR